MEGITLSCMFKHNNEPVKPSEAELKEIFDVVREFWGAESDDDFPGWAESVYAVKFNFHSGSPGYVGDLFIVQGDALTDEPPLMLIRNPEGKLVRAFD
jgi:hypothetical protein